MALLSQLSDTEIDAILSQHKLKKFTPNSCVHKKKFWEVIKKTRREGIAIDMEEYVEGIRAVGIPLAIGRANTQVAIWALGLKGQIHEETIARHTKYFLKIAKEIEIRMTSTWG